MKNELFSTLAIILQFPATDVQLSDRLSRAWVLNMHSKRFPFCFSEDRLVILGIGVRFNEKLICLFMAQML